MLDRLGRFFFLRTQLGVLGDGAQAADLFVDFEQLSAQLPEAVKSLNFALRFAPLGGRGKGLTHGLAVDLPGQAVVRAMSGLAGLMAAAGRFAAAAADSADGSAAEVS